MTETQNDRMRRLAREHGAEVIEWVEACIDETETRFRWHMGQTTTADFERAQQRQAAARAALTPEQAKLDFLKE